MDRNHITIIFPTTYRVVKWFKEKEDSDNQEECIRQDTSDSGAYFSPSQFSLTAPRLM